MRYLVSTSLIALALVVSAAWTAPVAHAQDGEISNTSAPTVAQGDIVASTPTPAASASGADTPTPFPSNPAGNIGVFATVIQWIMSLFAWLVGVAAITLDTAVLYTVVGMGKYVENLSAIGVAWTVLRDVGNIALIFGFLAVGITVILNVDWYGGGKKLLPMLIIAAVFLNFSLFIAEAVIDVGNLFATQVYTQINGGQPAGTKGFDPGYSLRTTNEGVSDAIMAKLGLASIYNAARENKQVLEAGNSWIIGFMGILLFLVTAFVMFSLAFILIARFVILILLIILSPVGIAGLAIPKLQSSANLWWHTLFEQVFIAPVLLLMLYVALRVILDQNFLTGFGKTSNSAWASFFGGGSVANYGSMLLSFLVAMGLLLAVVLFAKKMSAFGASWATSMGGKLSFGATAWAGRSTAGWASQRFSEKLRKTRFARVPVLGRAAIGGLDKGAKATYDVRGVKKFGGLSAIAGDVGKPAEGGYRKWESEKIKEREAYAKDLKQGTREENMQKRAEAEKKRIEGEIQDVENRYKHPIADINDEIQSATRERAAAQGRGDTTAANRIQADIVRLRGARTAQQQAMDREINPKKLEVVNAQKEADTSRTAPQTQYAENILWGPGRYFNRNQVASKKIKDAAKKTKTDKDLDAIRKAIEQGENPPPTPPPPPPTAP